MTYEWGEYESRRAEAAQVRSTAPSAARVADSLGGGEHNFVADRKVAETLAALAPAAVTIRPAVQAFQQRVLRFLVGEAGIRQFIEIGTGFPSADKTHETAQALAPECRVVYVDSDPMVLSHARAGLRSAPGGSVDYVAADVSDAAATVAGAQATLDLAQPVAAQYLFTLAFLLDTAAAATTVATLAAALPSGSYVVLYQLASDLDPAVPEGVRQWNQFMPAQQIAVRSKAEMAQLAAGLELVPPGLVPVTEWRPEPDAQSSDTVVPVYCLVGRKP
jgi:hypothetical protein